VRLFYSAVLRKLDQVKDFDALRTRELWVEGRRRRLRVALDGEVMRMALPLHYRSKPAALRVMVPAVEVREQSAKS
jgi:diacylglycerol kinase family enzyme